MSVELDWASLTPVIADQFTNRLNELLQNIARPEFLGPVEIHSISFGEIPPELEIIDVTDVSHGFTLADNDKLDNPHPQPATPSAPTSRSSSVKVRKNLPEGYQQQDSSFHTSSPISSSPESQAPSLQIHLRLSYSGNLRIQFSTALVLNYPSPDFMRLPLKATIAGINFDAEIILAIEGDRSRLHLSLIELSDALDETDSPQPTKDDGLHPTSTRFHHQSHPLRQADNFNLGPSSPASHILSNMFIETELGNLDKHLLRNVHKVEKFLIESFRKLINDELLYPTFQTFKWG